MVQTNRTRLQQRQTPSPLSPNNEEDVPTVNRPPVAELYDHAARLRRLEEVLVEVMGHLDAVSSQLIEQAELTRSNMLAINQLITAVQHLTGKPSHDL